jgi:hypothetical protein
LKRHESFVRSPLPMICDFRLQKQSEVSIDNRLLKFGNEQRTRDKGQKSEDDPCPSQPTDPGDCGATRRFGVWFEKRA